MKDIRYTKQLPDHQPIGKEEELDDHSRYH